MSKQKLKLDRASVKRGVKLGFKAWILYGEASKAFADLTRLFTNETFGPESCRVLIDAHNEACYLCMDISQQVTAPKKIVSHVFLESVRRRLWHLQDIVAVLKESAVLFRTGTEVLRESGLAVTTDENLRGSDGLAN